MRLIHIQSEMIKLECNDSCLAVFSGPTSSTLGSVRLVEALKGDYTKSTRVAGSLLRLRLPVIRADRARI